MGDGFKILGVMGPGSKKIVFFRYISQLFLQYPRTRLFDYENI